MNRPGEPLEEFQPEKYNKEVQLLPGSEERKAKLVKSLEELKNQMEEDNKKSNLKTRRINKFIIVSSIGIAATLLLGSKGLKLNKLLKTIGMILSIGSLIKGVAGVGNTYIDVIEPKNKNLDKNYSYVPLNKNNKYDLLRTKVVEVVMDTVLALNIMSKIEMKARVKALKYKQTSDVAKKLINEMLKYEYNR